MEKHLEATEKRLGEIRKPQLRRGKAGWRTGEESRSEAREKTLSKRRNRRIFHWWDSATLGSLVDRPRKKFGEPARPINPALMSTLTTIHPDHRPGLKREMKRKGRGGTAAVEKKQARWKRRGWEQHRQSCGFQFSSATLYTVRRGSNRDGGRVVSRGREGVSNAKEGLEEWRTQGRKRATKQTYSEKAATGTESGGTCKAAMKAHSFWMVPRASSWLPYKCLVAFHGSFMLPVRVKSNDDADLSLLTRFDPRRRFQGG